MGKGLYINPLGLLTSALFDSVTLRGFFSQSPHIGMYYVTRFCIPIYLLGWDRLHGSDQGCPRKSDSWDVLHQPTGTSSGTTPDTRGYEAEKDESTRMGLRQLSVSSDSRLLEDEIKHEVKVILRPKKPPRPQSEVFLDQVDKRRTKRYSAFGVSQNL